MFFYILIKFSYINLMVDAVIVSKRMRLIERQSIYGEVGVEITLTSYGILVEWNVFVTIEFAQIGQIRLCL